MNPAPEEQSHNQLQAQMSQVCNKEFANSKDIVEQYPLDVELINNHQQEELKQKKSKLKAYLLDDKTGYTKIVLNDKRIILLKNKIYISPKLRTRVLNWYHLYLCHPGENRLTKKIQQTCD